jgi:hypothetical protein
VSRLGASTRNRVYLVAVRRLLSLLVLALALPAAVALAGHVPGSPCTDCASHAYWPTIDGRLDKTGPGGGTLRGTRRSDQLMGHHGKDVLRGLGGRDVIWGDHIGDGQPKRQRDRLYGGGGTDFIYGSHGRNVIFAGKGNDAVSVHFGRGFLDCGPGRDIYHVPRSRKMRWKIRNCEKVDHRSESQRGGKGLKPLRTR